MSYFDSLTSQAAESMTAPMATAAAVTLPGKGPEGGDLALTAIVGRLRGRTIENNNGTLVSREVVTVHFYADQVAGIDLLDAGLQATVAKYPGAAFSVVEEETDLGGPLVRVTLARRPLVAGREMRKAA